MENNKFCYRTDRSIVASDCIISSANEPQRIFDEFSVNNKSKLTFGKTKALLWFLELFTSLPYCKITSRSLDRALIAVDEQRVIHLADQEVY